MSNEYIRKTTLAVMVLCFGLASVALAWEDRDIGAVSAAGSVEVSGNVYTVRGDGADIWGSSDAFHYMYLPMSGDGDIVARVISVQNTNSWAKAGVMIRETLNAGSAHAMMVVTPGSGTDFQWRTSTGGSSSNAGPTAHQAPYWVWIKRTGSTFTGYVSPDGNTWTQQGSTTITMAENVYIGLCVTSHIYGTLCTAKFDSFTIFRQPLVIYVDADAPGLNNGSSWTDAYKYLQDGLTDARSSPKPVEIWVAQGTYRPDEDTLHPDGTGDRMAAFQLINGVAVYGGFPAGGGNWNQRNPNDPNNETILSGDIGTPLDKSDNCYHIFYHPDGLNLDDTAILDGFTITGGNANGGDWPHNCGSGMFNSVSSPTVTNCTFSGNLAEWGGGGMYNGYSSPTLEGCTFSGNSANHYGGGMYNYTNSSPTIKGCTFSGNFAEWAGGGMHNGYSSPTLTNCTFSGNSTNIYGGGMFNSYSSPTLTNCTFSENSAGVGGAIYCNNGSPFISNCIITRNTSLGEAGGLSLYYCSLPVIDNCTISHNSPNVIWIYQTTADISGTVKVDSENIIGDGGSLWIEPGSTLETSDCNLSCNIVGIGTVLVPAGREFVIENEAVVDLSGDGTLQCNGLLRVKDYGNLLYTNLNVARASFEDNAVVAYNTITTSVLAPYGQLLAKDTASIIGNDIRAAGDRYIDIDPSTFTGTIQGNSISVTITEGTGNISAGLFELRGYDYFCSASPCPPGIFPLPEMPEFSLSTWPIDRMELVEGAKLTLTNRSDFQSPYDEGGEYEVLYVKQLILGPNSVLDTAFNRLYYETLEKDSTAKVKKNTPLLGFSLGKIDFDDPEQFAARTINNNFIDPNPAPPDTTRIQVERVEGQSPDPTGMMLMRNLPDLDPESPTYGKIIKSRTKALFAKCTEEKILIRFKYLFNTAEPGTELVVYLSDVPELLDPNDPMRDYHYIEVARIPAPPVGRPGSAGSGRFGVFQKTVSTEGLNFSEGTRVEVELVEPQAADFQPLAMGSAGLEAIPPGASVFLDSWSAEIHCEGICLDITWDNVVNEVDFVTVLCACGCASELLPDGTGSYACFEGPFTRDGYIDSYDTTGWDWTLNSDGRKNLCDGVPLSETTESDSLEADNIGASGALTPLESPADDFNDLLILGKRGTSTASNKLKDRLYVFDSSPIQYVRYQSLTPERSHNKIVQDPNGTLYRINMESGVRKLDQSAAIIPPGQTIVAEEPRYNKSATVYVGVKGEGENAVGRPVLDVAFDSGYAYVVPVVVNPDGNDSYAAAAKLQLLSSGNPPYSVVKLYDDPPPPADNQYRNNLREIEIDSSGNIYVLNVHALNESDILWRYYPNGTRERINLADPDINLPDPIALYMSNATDMLYMASAQYNADDYNDSVIYGFSTKGNLTLTRSITINDMHHVTGITEDPDSGALWITGFNMDQIPEYPDPSQEPFYSPRLAKVPLGSNNVQSQSLSGSDLAMPLSILWSKSTKCGGADLDNSNSVNFDDFALFRRRWRSSNCTPPQWCEGADINNSKTVELMDLAVLAQHWLQTGCQE
jgi:parallel beta-helix repeat protein/predicted outer membrane repeat protein